MGTRSRLIGGLAVASLSVAITLAAAGQIYLAWRAGSPPTERRVPRDRAFAVEVGTLTAGTVTPVITAYGHLAAGRTLELRSAVAGALVELSPNFRDGGTVKAGEVLFRIDPARLESARALAESNLAEAKADLAEAEATLGLARLDAAAAGTQYELRVGALTRQQDLRSRGVSTDADVEAAVLARAAAEQTLTNRRQAVVGDEARVEAAKIAIERMTVALADAERAVRDATVRAPFDGVVSGPTAVTGRLVSANEVMGKLIDPGEIEVAFRVTNTQFARLLNDARGLRKAEATVVIQSGHSSTETPATLVRAGPEVGEGQVGRLVYARLTDAGPALVKPGDFVTVRVPERPLEGVAVIPAAAATTDGRLLILGEGNRLEEVQARLLRQQGDTLIVGDVPFGRKYVLARALQLGAGIRVEPVAPPPAGQPGETVAAPVAPEPDTIALDDARRAAIVDFVNASTTMKPEMREKFLEELSRPEVPRATVEKFEAKMSEGQ